MSDGRVVVVTGASAGIGRAAAVEFGRRGDRVALLARGRTGLEAAAKEVEAAGGSALVVEVDVADAAAVEAAADTVTAALGDIDVWVNNAFTSVFAPFHEVTAEEFARVTQVTYLGFVHGTMSALRRMRPRDRGAIVQVGSALAHRAIPLQSAYCGAKHATAGFTESLRTELLHEGSGVAVTIVQMPAVDTPQFSWVRSRLPEKAQPVPPLYAPEVAGRAIVHAADHPRRKEYWVGGPTVGTVLGQRLAPAVMDRYLARTGYDSQQTGEPESPGRPDNLFAPLDGDGGTDAGVRGEFGEEAHARSLQFDLGVLVRSVAGGVVGGARGLLGATLGRVR